MYLWRIRRLRRELIAAPLSEGASVSYLIAFTLFYFVLIMLHSLVPSDPPPAWYPLYLTLLFAIKIIGICICYRVNGGSKGENFLKRYIALAWVELIRFIGFGCVVLVLGIFTIELFVGQQLFMTPHFLWIATFILLWLIAYYWRLTAHFRFVKGSQGGSSLKLELKI